MKPWKSSFQIPGCTQPGVEQSKISPSFPSLFAGRSASLEQASYNYAALRFAQLADQIGQIVYSLEEASKSTSIYKHLQVVFFSRPRDRYFLEAKPCLQSIFTEVTTTEITNYRMTIWTIKVTSYFTYPTREYSSSQPCLQFSDQSQSPNHSQGKNLLFAVKKAPLSAASLRYYQQSPLIRILNSTPGEITSSFPRHGFSLQYDESHDVKRGMKKPVECSCPGI